MNKLIFILLFIPSFLFGYSINDIKVNFSDKNFELILRLEKGNDNISVDENFYSNGVNLLLHNIEFDKISMKKFNSKLLSNIKIIPLSNGNSLLKIQTNDKFFKNMFKIIKNSDELKIRYGEFKENKINKIPDKEDKIIENLTKKFFEEEKNIKNPVNEKKEKVHFLEDSKSFTERIVKTYSLLAIICIFLIGIGFFIKKLKMKQGLYFKDNDIFKIVYKFDVAPKKSIAIVKVYDEYLLIGITEYNISLLAKIESENLKEEIKLLEGKRETSKFIRYLKEKENVMNSKESLINEIEEKIRRLRAR